jgi:hypothetical protein
MSLTTSIGARIVGRLRKSWQLRTFGCHMALMIAVAQLGLAD